MFAIIESGGKQYKVREGDVVCLEKLEGLEGQSVAIDRVLAAQSKDSDTLNVGQPFLDGLKVHVKIIKHARAEKVIIFKKRRRQNYRRKNGHRQPTTFVRVLSLG